MKMKRKFYRVGLICTIFLTYGGLFNTFQLYGKKFKPERYQEIEIHTIKATPEEYKGDRICFKTKYNRYETTFPPYAERSGIKAGKYYYINVIPGNFPVIGRKKDSFNDVIPTLKRGATIKCYGKVKKFRSPPKQTRFPHYYLLLENLEIIKEKPDEKDEPQNQDSNNIKKRFRRKWKNKTQW